MGYSVAIRAKSERNKKWMYDFMERHYNPQAIIKYDPSHRLSMNSGNMTMDYDSAKTAIGFDYSCMPDPENFYVFTVCRWMALKIGRKRHFKDVGSTPYYVYDGYEAWPILVNPVEAPKNRRWCVVDEYGFKSILSCRPKGWIQSLSFILSECHTTPKKIDKIVRKELIRLDTLWKQEEKNRDQSLLLESMASGW